MSKIVNRLLIVSSEHRENSSGLQRLLQADGISADCASTAALALNLLSVHRYALALVDVELSDGSGLDLCRHLSQSGARGAPVMLAVSPEITLPFLDGLEAGALISLSTAIGHRELYLHVRNFMLSRIDLPPSVGDGCRFARLGLAQCVLDTLPGAVIITDARQRVVDTSAAFAGLTGLDPQAVRNRTIQDLFATFRFNTDIDSFLMKLAIDGVWQGELISEQGGKRSRAFWLNAQAIGKEGCAAEHHVFFLTDIAHHKRREQRLRTLAETDALTGAANRNLFIAQLDDAIRRTQEEGDSPSILFLDLDSFKEVNDHLGHGQGDTLLRDIADILQDSVRANDLVARLGGDEFAVLLLDASRQALTETAQRIVKRLIFFFTGHDGHRIEVTCSVGIAVYPQDGLDSAGLLKQADRAMYKAKGRGKHGYCFASEPTAGSE